MNINFTDLEKLIKLAECADIKSLEVTDGDARISIVCQSDGYDSGNHISQSADLKASNLGQQAQAPQTSTANHINEGGDGIDKTVAVEVTETKETQVLAPMLGTFYLRSEPTAEAFFKVGDQVAEGQTLCIIEAMKMMHEVKAEADGTIQEILIDEGDVVEYAQPLFMIAPNS